MVFLCVCCLWLLAGARSLFYWIRVTIGLIKAQTTYIHNQRLAPKKGVVLGPCLPLCCCSGSWFRIQEASKKQSSQATSKSKNKQNCTRLKCQDKKKKNPLPRYRKIPRKGGEAWEATTEMVFETATRLPPLRLPRSPYPLLP